MAETRVVNETTGGEKGTKTERMELLPWDVLRQDVAPHYAKGAEKYADNNWRRGFSWSLAFGALQRHAAQFWGGEDIDEETGTPHMAAVAFHALALLLFMREHRALDDRPSTVMAQDAGWADLFAFNGEQPTVDDLHVPAKEPAHMTAIRSIQPTEEAARRVVAWAGNLASPVVEPVCKTKSYADHLADWGAPVAQLDELRRLQAFEDAGKRAIEYQKENDVEEDQLARPTPPLDLDADPGPQGVPVDESLAPEESQGDVVRRVLAFTTRVIPVFRIGQRVQVTIPPGDPYAHCSGRQGVVIGWNNVDGRPHGVNPVRVRFDGQRGEISCKYNELRVVG